MLKKHGLLLLCLLGFACVKAQQVNMTIQVPPTGVMAKSQLWNMVLVNSGNDAVTVYVSLSFLSTTDNRAVMTAVTRPVLLVKGAKQLTAKDIAPISYTYLSSAFSGDMNPDGLLPVGNYLACYTVYAQVYESTLTLAEDCVPVEVQPLSPPQLNTPADQSVLDVTYPQFTWLPPMPLQLFGNLQYDFILAAMQPGQSAYQAIQQNLPVFNTHSGNVPFLNYPASNVALDTGVNYAWCVVARNNREFIAQSEVWTFKVKQQDIVKNNLSGSGYVRLQNGMDASIAASNGNLQVVYNNETNDSLVHYSIRLIDDGSNTEIAGGAVAVRKGNNYLEIAAGKRKLESRRVYLFQLINSRNEWWSKKFMYTKDSE